MRDKNAREQIEAMDERVDKLEELNFELGDLRVRYCKKCKHDTIQRRKYRHGGFRLWSTGSSNSDDTSGDCNYTCLTCGTEWECRDKTVCAEVKPKPTKKKTTKK